MTSENKIKSFISSIASIEKESLDEFCSMSTPKAVSKGEVLIQEDSIAKKLYFIHKGIFRYYIISPDGKDITKDFAVDEDNPFCTAYSSFMTNQPSQIFIESLTDSEISIWDRSYIFPLLTQNIHWLPFSQRIATGMYIRKEKKEISLMRDSAAQRYRFFQDAFPSLSKRIPQHYIATYLNITPESLSRIKKKLAP